MAHVAPVTPTLILANVREYPGRLQLLHLEDLDRGLANLVSKSGFNLTRVMQKETEIIATTTNGEGIGKKILRRRRQLAPHPTSKDEFRTTRAAKEFLGNLHLVRRGHEAADSARLGVNMTAAVREPRYHYLRALCRLYISDYICADYASTTLPAVCANILEDEVPALIREYTSRNSRVSWLWLWTRLFSLSSRKQ